MILTAVRPRLGWRREPNVHVAGPDGEAKFWLEPEITLVRSHGLSQQEIARVKRLANEHREEIKDAWRRHFGG